MRTWIFFILLFASKGTFCQENIVPNGGFESVNDYPTSFLPDNGNYFDYYVNNWYAPTNGTPDLFYQKDTSKFPENSKVSYPIIWNYYSGNSNVKEEFVIASKENAFSGLTFGIYSKFDKTNIGAEYIQTKLTEPIKPLHKYRLRLSYRESIISNSEYLMLGIHFSEHKITNYYNSSIENPYFSRFNPKINDYFNFERGSLSTWSNFDSIIRFQAVKNYITIGSFNIEKHPIYKDSLIFSYYFIDNISLIELPCLVGQDTACIDEEVTFYSTFPGPFEWWHQGQVISRDSVIQFTADSSGWYYLKTPHGEDSLFLTVVNNNIIATDLTTDFCEGEDTDISFNPSYQVLWKDGKTQNPRTFNESTEISATVSDRYCSKTVNVTVREKPAPKADIPQKTFICPNDQESFVTLNLPQHYQYIWSDGLNLSSRTFSQAGVFTVTLIDTNQCSTQNTLEIVASCKEEIWVPNAFAPNGVNTTFKPHLKYISSATLTIYNRWGEQIYSETSQSPSWDGVYKGSLCPMGVYFYRLEVALPHGKTEKLSGNIHLLR